MEGSILTPWSHIYVFRINLEKNQLGIVTAKELEMNNASVDHFSEASKALIGINGGFFDHAFKPLGLRINHSSNINFAIQSGPRLLIKNVIPSLKPGIADRTAMGITKQGQVILLVTNNSAMTLSELARLLQSPPLYCVDAINLDGGSSSQLYAHINSFQLNVRGFSNVSDAVIVKPH